jgi:FHA domain-containing protein
VEAVSAERVVVEGLDGQGRIQWRERLVLNGGRRAFTIGRSIEADVTLDDPHAAALHACVEITEDGRLLASDLGSVNGLVVCGKRWSNARDVELPDNRMQIGRTHLRVRTAHERLEPEAPYELIASSPARGPAWIAAVAALVGGSQLVYTSWLSAPRDLAVGIVTALAIAGAVAVVWVALWGLLSRVMQGEWRWLHHAAIALGVAAVFVAVVGMVDLAGFLLAIPSSSSRYAWIGAVALAGALFLHLKHAASLDARHAALIACGIPVLLAGGNHWLQERSQVRDVNYVGTRLRIYPPGLRLLPSESLEDYFTRTTSLRALADKRLADALADEPGKDGEN